MRTCAARVRCSHTHAEQRWTAAASALVQTSRSCVRLRLQQPALDRTISPRNEAAVILLPAGRLGLALLIVKDG